MRALALMCFAVFAAGCGGCGPSGNTCHVDNECNGTDVCLASHACAPKCDAMMTCGSGDKCSSSGGCVPMNGCGADSECSSGNVCEGVMCQPTCLTAGCSNGGSCQVDGHCSAPGADAGNTCGGELFQSTMVQANFLIVLDHSGSMKETLPNSNGQSKWQLATTAVKNITMQYDSSIRFGLSMFSTTTHCDPGANAVPVGDNTASAIATALPGNANGDGTPIGGALDLALHEPSLKDPTRANFVLLATDGEENCGGDPVSEVTQLAAAGVKTYVVGFGGQVDKNMLNAMATAGGTARPGMTQYYQADDPTTLSTAFMQIAQGAVGCDFKLGSTPPDPSKINVVIGSTLIPKDPTNQSGWDYNSMTNRITLYGPACNLVQQTPGIKVSIIYGCPDPSIVETGGGGDGGFTQYDGGIPGLN